VKIYSRRDILKEDLGIMLDCRMQFNVIPQDVIGYNKSATLQNLNKIRVGDCGWPC